MINFEHVSYPPGVIDASFKVSDGEKVAIIGRSGSGKTTLLRLLCGSLRPKQGNILAPTRGEFAYIPQDLDASLNPAMYIKDIILEPIAIARQSIQTAQRKIPSLLEQLGLPNDAAQRKPGELSGGQRQRVGIARALIAEPKIIYADEALSSLDNLAASMVIELFSEPNLTVLLVTHNLESAEAFAQRFVILDQGHIVEDADIAILRNIDNASDARKSFLKADALLGDA